VAELLRKGKSFLICSHLNPDGDAIGSSLALAAFLEEEGKEVFLFNRDNVPPMYAFLTGASRVRQRLPEGQRFDATVLLDCATLERVGEELERFEGRGRMIIIDHHPPVDSPPGTVLIRTDAAATAELLYEVFRSYGAHISPRTATALYLGLMTDTGSFRFSNTTPKALSVAAALVEAGADHGLVTRRIYEEFPPERFRLLARVLDTLTFFHEGKVAAVTVTRRMLDSTGAGHELTEGFVDYPRSIRGVEVAVLFREVDEQQYRVSLRSRGRVDVGRIAQIFQGGGHPNAAGCTLWGDHSAVQEQVMSHLKEVLE